MTIHLISDPNGVIFGLYRDRQLVSQRYPMNPDDLLTALGIENHLIVFDEEDMKMLTRLPASLDDIEITGLLGESATIESVRFEAERRENDAES